jgi:hypothetical protein
MPISTHNARAFNRTGLATVTPGSVGFLGDENDLTVMGTGAETIIQIGPGTYDGIFFDGGVYCTGAGHYRFQQCVAQGKNASWLTMAYEANVGAAGSFTVQDSTLRWKVGDDPSLAQFGNGSITNLGVALALTVQRCDISGMPIGIQAAGNVVIEECWMHDLPFWGTVPTSNTHGEALAFYHGRLWLRGNYLDMHATSGYATACCFFQPVGGGQIDEVVAEHNYFNGGAFTYYAEAGQHIVRFNRFGDDRLFGTHAFTQTATVTEWRGNVLANDDILFVDGTTASPGGPNALAQPAEATAAAETGGGAARISVNAEAPAATGSGISPATFITARPALVAVTATGQNATTSGSGTLYVTPGTVGFLGDENALTDVNLGGGDVVHTLSAGTYDGQFFHGGLYLDGPGTFLFQECVIEGTELHDFLVYYADTLTGNGIVTFEDCTLRWQAGDTLSPGGQGAIQNGGISLNVTVQRCDISDKADGLQLSGKVGGMVYVIDNYIHDLVWAGTFPTNTHNDGLQFYGGNLTCQGNYFDVGAQDPFSNSCCFFQGGEILDVLTEGNYFSGGGYSYYVQNGDHTVRNNTFGPDHLFGTHFYEGSGWTNVEWSGNVDHLGNPVSF